MSAESVRKRSDEVVVTRAAPAGDGSACCPDCATPGDDIHFWWLREGNVCPRCGLVEVVISHPKTFDADGHVAASAQGIWRQRPVTGLDLLTEAVEDDDR